MKKIALIYGSWLNAPTGASKVVKSLVENRDFLRNGVEIVSFSMDTISPRNYDVNIRNKISVISRIKDIINFISQYSSLIALFSLYITYMRHAKAIVRYYKDNINNIDTIFIHDMYTCYYFLKYKCPFEKLVLVLHTNGEPLKMEKCYHRSLARKRNIGMEVLLRMYKKVINSATDICFVAQNPANTFCKLNPEINPSKVHYIYNGLPDLKDGRQYVHNERKEIVCVGSVTERKGQRMLVDAICLIAQEKKIDFHVTVLGDGVIRSALEKKIKDNNLSDYISFKGFTNNVDQYLIASDIFILPSKDEGFPMSILEAMRLSLPIISTKIAGIPEMVKTGYNGILVEPSTKEIYNVLLNIDKYNWEEMGTNSRKLFLNQFIIDGMVNKYSDILL